ncbi:hypothetical protein HAV15_007438 [Penicillium sp. str. |nr:hypothetical protein HAV15_007438 [Penicillium sp. str. \
MAGGFSIFPLELWLMIFQYLREESPQHISILAQTCKSFYQELNLVIYQPVRLRRLENARRFANTISGRPDLAALVKEVRHAEDMGFADFAGYSEPFYKALAKLPSLETLVMRKTLHPSTEYSPQTESQEVLTQISNAFEYLGVPESYLEDLLTDMGNRGYPLGDASDSFGLGFHPCEEDFSLQGLAQDLAERTYFSRDYLQDLIPALRTCHIGTDSDLNPDMYQPFINFNETIFTLPHLQKLCITGARFRRFGLEEASIDNRATSLKELLLLNCEVTPHDLALIIRFPRALERLTIRVPSSDVLDTQYDMDDYSFFSDKLNILHSESLEYVDLDIYWGTDYGIILHPFAVLSEVVITFTSMFGHIDEWIILPESLQKLTFRHEEGMLLQLSPLLDDIEDGNLPTALCDMPNPRKYQ